MKEIYILDYANDRICHFSIDLTDYSNEAEIIELEIETKGFNLDEVSYMISDYELMIEELC